MTTPNLLDARALESAMSTASRLEGELESLIAADTGTIAHRRDRMNAELERLGGGPELAAALLKSHKADSAKVLEASNDKRWSKLKEMSEMDQRATVARDHYTPIALATSHQVGSEERGRFLAEYSGLGPAALARAAARAKLTGNKVEAAALITVNDRSPRADRGFSSQDLANFVFGEDSKRANVMIDSIKRAFANSMARNRTLEGKPLTPTESIRHALNHGTDGPRISNRGPVTVVKLGRDKSALAKLEAGLREAQ